eukprot:TRINITY_DN75_c0_g1_i3.p1 TRINITY_DN75_c0_g1~~TRINITY_DN75_c0_g1_i3.p1  ORF type:complete len:170 (-),score=50.73 TRINITY_DN75_c0_g1_i3:48-557(-)
MFVSQSRRIFQLQQQLNSHKSKNSSSSNRKLFTMGNSESSSSHSSQKFLEPTSPMAMASKESRLKNPPKHKEETAIVATGCFWGPDHLVKRQFGGGRGLISSKTGYIGGNTSKPSYKQVCSGTTGHAEAVKVVYDPSLVSYPEVIEFFMRTHDATDKGGQVIVFSILDV